MDDLISRQNLLVEMKKMYEDAEKWKENAKTDGILARAESCMATMTELKLRVEKLPSAQQWHVIERTPMTEDERKEWSERLGYDIEYEYAYFYSNLPDDGQEVLVSTQYGVYEDTFHQDEECYFEANGDMDGILAWMPLPDPYKGNGTD